METVDTSFVDEIVARIGREQSAVIPILQAIQKQYRYLPQEALERVSQISDITAASIWGVATFYNQFRHRPVGRHIIHVCHGTACHVKGAELVHDALRRQLNLKEGEDTDAEGMFTLEKIACLGCCTLAPAVQIDNVTYGHLTAQRVPQMLEDFLELQKSRAELPQKPPLEGLAYNEGEIRLGLGSCCVARGSGRLQQAITKALTESGIKAQLKRVGCVGMCHQTPLMEIIPANGRNYFYAGVQPEDARSILLKHFKPKGIGKRIKTIATRAVDNILNDRGGQSMERYAIDVREQPISAFLDKQIHIATEYSGQIDPLDLEEYLAKGGFAALKKCVQELEPGQVIEELQRSGLRGRGGAGFPTGNKWANVRSAAGGQKYLICNGDEGDPGAFMDRMLLESYPFRIIEGMAIAAYAIGAREGYFYIRAEYPLAVQRVKEAVRLCEEKNLLRNNNQKTDARGTDDGFSLELKVFEGAGAFVCGEESALIASIEGRRGMPRYRPPYPAEQGLWGRPTLVNNVETYALVPWIIRQGAEAFAGLGTAASKGTKVFALAGKVARGGLIEVPMGITINQIVQEIGGGIAEGRRFKAVQIGGPSGGCVPAEKGDIPVDYEALDQAGAIMGSGGMVVLDENDCMVDIARYFLEFTQDQSCGKCTFCRVGTRRMLEILQRLCEGEGKQGDLEELEQLAIMVQKGSMCGLGKTAPNPVLTTLRYFRGEYEAHLAGGCPAGRCKALITYSITDDCIGCTLCAQNCPAEAIALRPYEQHEIDREKCIRCGNCKNICPEEAVKCEKLESEKVRKWESKKVGK